MKDRVEVLKIHSRNKRIGESINFEELARDTPGFSGADLENLLNDAALLAARRRKGMIEREEVEETRDKIMLGLERVNLALDTTTSGAENDLKQATRLARKMVLDWGMSERFAQISLGSEREQVFLGKEIAHRRR